MPKRTCCVRQRSNGLPTLANSGLEDVYTPGAAQSSYTSGKGDMESMFALYSVYLIRGNPFILTLTAHAAFCYEGNETITSSTTVYLKRGNSHAGGKPWYAALFSSPLPFPPIHPPTHSSMPKYCASVSTRVNPVRARVGPCPRNPVARALLLSLSLTLSRSLTHSHSLSSLSLSLVRCLAHSGDKPWYATAFSPSLIRVLLQTQT